MNVCPIKHIHSPSANRQQDPLEFGPTIFTKITIQPNRRNLSLTGYWALNNTDWSIEPVPAKRQDIFGISITLLVRGARLIL
jgi:hypothetical protein